MFPTSVLTVLIIVVAILPGAVYTWAYEREAASFGITAADRTLRFIATALIFHAVLGWPEYWLYRAVFVAQSFGPRQFLAGWSAGLMLFLLPALTGTLIGGLYSSRNSRDGWVRVRRALGPVAERRLLRVALGRDPAPRAWDDLFSDRPTVYIRARTSEGSWVAGLFAEASYAAGFPNDTDLYLEQARDVDPATGVIGDVALGYGVYLPAGKIEWLEIVPPAPAA